MSRKLKRCRSSKCRTLVNGQYKYCAWHEVRDFGKKENMNENKGIGGSKHEECPSVDRSA
jgi:hypothetical protein